MLAAAALGVNVSEFGICLLGAYNCRARANSRRNEILISLAGPLVNFALAFPCFLLPHIGFELALCNLVLALFNLLPIPSSDGLRFLKTFWGHYPVIRVIPEKSPAEPALRQAA